MNLIERPVRARQHTTTHNKQLDSTLYLAVVVFAVGDVHVIAIDDGAGLRGRWFGRGCGCG